METNFESVLNNLADQVKSFANTETVLGDEFTLGEFVCRPVIKVGTGYGSGAGEGQDPKSKAPGSGVGAGAAVGVSPVGFLVAKGDEISFIQSDKKSGFSALMEKVPEMVEKMAEMKKKEDSEEAKEEKKEAKKGK